MNDDERCNRDLCVDINETDRYKRIQRKKNHSFGVPRAKDSAKGSLGAARVKLGLETSAREFD